MDATIQITGTNILFKGLAVYFEIYLCIRLFVTYIGISNDLKNNFTSYLLLIYIFTVAMDAYDNFTTYRYMRIFKNVFIPRSILYMFNVFDKYLWLNIYIPINILITIYMCVIFPPYTTICNTSAYDEDTCSAFRFISGQIFFICVNLITMYIIVKYPNENVVNRIVHLYKKIRYNRRTQQRQQSGVYQPLLPMIAPGVIFNTDCSICLDPFVENDGIATSILPCGHKFHDICVNAWFINSRTCPTCRQVLIITT